MGASSVATSNRRGMPSRNLDTTGEDPTGRIAKRENNCDVESRFALRGMTPSRIPLRTKIRPKGARFEQWGRQSDDAVMAASLHHCHFSNGPEVRRL